MRGKLRFNVRIKFIYAGILLLVALVIFVMNYAYQNSRNLLIEQEAGIISQYMDRNKLALVEITDSIRKVSAASSTNQEIATLLGRSYKENMYSSDNVDRIREVEKNLAFYRNIFFDYRMHYIILGEDGTTYSVADGVDNSAYLGAQFAQSVRQQLWYQQFLESDQVSQWIMPCRYNKKGEFSSPGEDETGEDFILFVRKIRDYNTLKQLGISFVAFPTENLEGILVPYEGASMVLLNEDNQLVYVNEQTEVPVSVIEAGTREPMEGGDGYFHYLWEGREYLINYVSIPGADWKIASGVALEQITAAVDSLSRTVFTLMFVVVLGAIGICLMMYIYINAPMNRLIKKIKRVSIGETRISDVEEVQEHVFGIGEAESWIGRMVDYMERLSAQTLKQKEIEENLRYEMLRAQLNPHFLFNTLNAIKWSALISGAGNIADMITSLGILLENSMNRREEEIPLQEEIRVVKAWVEIKNWALKNRIQVHIDIPENLQDFPVIRFCLQPLVENAVLHGMERAEHGEIWIQARRNGETVCVSIRDNGIGICEDRLNEIIMEMDSKEKRRHVTGIGLRSIHELMRIKYGPEFGLHIVSVQGEGTVVSVVFPGRMK